MRILTSLAWALVLVGGLGCGPSDGAADLDVYFNAQPYGNAACNTVDDRLSGLREMRLYYNGRPNVPAHTQGLARYYRRHALTFFTDLPVQATTMAYALDTNTTALSLALIQAFPGVDLSDEQALMADPVLWGQIVAFVANFMFKPMVDFANSHSDGGTGRTNLIVVPSIERPGGDSIADPGTSVAGLAISPALLAEFARTMPAESNIWADVDLPAQFTPMMVLGDDVLAATVGIDPELRDLVVSHEFGHTAALIHSEIPRNLMFQGVAPGLNDCTDGLDDGQLAIMRATLGVGTSASASLRAGPLGARPSPGATPARPPITPAGVRALLAGDRQALRSFVERMFHGPAAL